MTEVTLSWFEVYTAAQAGALRRIEAMKRGRQDRWGADGDGWTRDIDGCIAELAVAKHLGRYWESVARDPGTLAGDVGTLQVRSTRRPDGCLILHPDDDDEALFVLVVGTAPTVRIAGAMRGRAAKLERWWRTDTGRPAFFVPQHALDLVGHA